MKEKKSNHLIGRRETLRLIGAAGAAALVGWDWEPTKKFLPAGRGGATVSASQLSCVVRPQQTEGPYFVDERLNRSDIRVDPSTNTVKDGLPLLLRINVSRVNGGDCTPLVGAYVDVWHCDALGSYSDVRDASFDTRGQKYLRGYQMTDDNGTVEFQTIYPGWYTGRAVHIHFKIRLFTGSQTAYEFTSQLYFDDSVTDQVHAQPPYNTKGTRNMRNSRDGIFNNGGSQLMLNLTQNGQGYVGTFNIGLEGIAQSDPQSDPPAIISAAVSGKKLIVTGANFSAGAMLFMNGEQQKKTANDALSPTTTLIAGKSGKKIGQGQTVTLQVRNADNTLSTEFLFTRPVE